MTIKGKLFTIFFPLITMILLVLVTLFYTQYKRATLNSLKPVFSRMSGLIVKSNRIEPKTSPLPILQIIRYSTKGKKEILYLQEQNFSIGTQFNEDYLYLHEPILTRIQEDSATLTPYLTYFFPTENGGYIEITFYASTIKDQLRHFLSISLVIFALSAGLFALFFAYFNRIYARPLKDLSFAGLNIVSHKMTTLPESKIKEIQDLSKLMTTLGATINEQNERLKEASFIHKKQTLKTEVLSFLIDQLFTKVFAKHSDPLVNIEAIEIETDHPWGIIFDIDSGKKTVDLELCQANEKGMQAFLALLQHRKGSSVKVQIERQDKCVHFDRNQMPAPLYFSKRTQKVTILKDKMTLQSGDYLFLINSGLEHFIPSEAFIELLEKYIKPFHNEGIKALTRLLEKELQIQEQKNLLHNDARMILIEIC